MDYILNLFRLLVFLFWLRLLVFFCLLLLFFFWLLLLLVFVFWQHFVKDVDHKPLLLVVGEPKYVIVQAFIEEDPLAYLTCEVIHVSEAYRLIDLL